jgi:hypothetical protein
LGSLQITAWQDGRLARSRCGRNPPDRQRIRGKGAERDRRPAQRQYNQLHRRARIGLRVTEDLEAGSDLQIVACGLEIAFLGALRPCAAEGGTKPLFTGRSFFYRVLFSGPRPSLWLRSTGFVTSRFRSATLGHDSREQRSSNICDISVGHRITIYAFESRTSCHRLMQVEPI